MGARFYLINQYFWPLDQGRVKVEYEGGLFDQRRDENTIDNYIAYLEITSQYIWVIIIAIRYKPPSVFTNINLCHCVSGKNSKRIILFTLGEILLNYIKNIL